MFDVLSMYVSFQNGPTGSHVSLVDTIAECWHVHSSSPMETWATTPHKPYKILGLHGHGVYRPLEKERLD